MVSLLLSLLLQLIHPREKFTKTFSPTVHFQHSAVLVDKLTRANVHNYRVQFYSDNNHAIRYHDANSNLYYLLTEYLWESFGGREYMHVRAETHGRFAGPLQDH